jgi:hypothetical protein
MALSAFDDKSRPPTPDRVAKVLGKARAAWDALRTDPALSGLREEWGFTSKASGWGLRLRDDERVIVYMTPREGRFLVSFALGEKAVAAARAAGLPAELLAAIDAAPRYAEGRGVRVEVRSLKDARGIAALAGIKRAS